MKLIVFSDSHPVRKEAERINAMIDLTQSDFHLYKPSASSDEICVLLDALNDDSLSQTVLHHHKILTSSYPVKGSHKARHQEICDHSVSLSAFDLQEPPDIQAVEYAFFSPIFSSLSKPDHHPKHPLEAINNWVSQSPYDYVALGGITPNNIDQLHGFSGIALKGALWQSHDPLSTLRLTLQRISTHGRYEY